MGDAMIIQQVKRLARLEKHETDALVAAGLEHEDDLQILEDDNFPIFLPHAGIVKWTKLSYLVKYIDAGGIIDDSTTMRLVKAFVKGHVAPAMTATRPIAFASSAIATVVGLTADEVRLLEAQGVETDEDFTMLSHRQFEEILPDARPIKLKKLVYMVAFLDAGSIVDASTTMSQVTAFVKARCSTTTSATRVGSIPINQQRLPRGSGGSALATAGRTGTNNDGLTTRTAPAVVTLATTAARVAAVPTAAATRPQERTRPKRHRGDNDNGISTDDFEEDLAPFGKAAATCCAAVPRTPPAPPLANGSTMAVAAAVAAPVSNCPVPTIPIPRYAPDGSIVPHPNSIVADMMLRFEIAEREHNEAAALGGAALLHTPPVPPLANDSTMTVAAVAAPVGNVPAPTILPSSFAGSNGNGVDGNSSDDDEELVDDDTIFANFRAIMARRRQARQQARAASLGSEIQQPSPK